MTRYGLDKLFGLAAGTIPVRDMDCLKVVLPTKKLDDKTIKGCERIVKDLYKEYTGEDYIKPISSLERFPLNKKLWENGASKKLENAQDKALGNLYNLKRKKASEIEQLLLKIEEKVAQIEEYDKEIDAYNELVQNYSTFLIEDINEVLASLLSVFEGEEYVYQNSHYYIYNGAPNEFLRKPYNFQAIIRKENQKVEYEDTEFHALPEQNRAILLSEKESCPRSRIIFYQSNEKHELTSTIDYGNFDYLKEFIDGVILYRMSNDLKEISKEQLNTLLQEYITFRREIIEEKYALVDREEENEFKEQLDKKRESRQKYLTSFLNN